MKVIASHNALGAVSVAWNQMAQGESPLDAVVAALTFVEDDPADLTVGFGGLPNADGVVELDAAVMDGRTHRGAGVAGLRDIRHAAQVARTVLQRTRRVLLVGQGARQFAIDHGFAVEDLLTERARQMWLYWRSRRLQHDDWVAPAPDDELELERWFARHFYRRRDHPTGTVHCSVQDARGDLACGASTSGHAFKIPGRVGDSPILGAGLYVDNELGACGGIGHGESNLQNLCSYACVESLRHGMAPVDAAMEAMRRVAQRTPAPWRDEQGRPDFELQLFVLSRQGEHAGAAMWSGKQMAVADERGARLEDCRCLYER